MRKGTVLVLLCLVGSAMGSPTPQSAVLFDQPLPEIPIRYGWNSDGSSSNATEPFASTVEIGDGFSLSAAASVASVTWWGSYWSGEVPAVAKEFELRFLSDMTGAGNLITSRTVTAVGEDTGLTVVSNIPGFPFTWKVMKYTVDLAAPVALDAGESFIAISENDSSTPAVWTWAFHQDPGSGSWYQPDHGADWLTAPGDMAFSLIGEPIPEAVSIDVRPWGGKRNHLRLRSRGLVPVAVLSDEGFDARDIDPETARIGDPNLSATGTDRWFLHDVDRDGDVDLVLLFRVRDLVEDCAINSDTETLTVTSTTRTGTVVAGSDGVEIVSRLAGWTRHRWSFRSWVRRWWSSR